MLAPRIATRLVVLLAALFFLGGCRTVLRPVLLEVGNEKYWDFKVKCTSIGTEGVSERLFSTRKEALKYLKEQEDTYYKMCGSSIQLVSWRTHHQK